MRDRDLNLATLAQLFVDEEKARKFLEAKRWLYGPVCPFCQGISVYSLTPKPTSKRPVRPGVYKCKACRKQFTVRIGTIFEDSHIPLSKWLMAIHLMTSSKKGVSSHQLSHELGITLKSAWFLSHRVREAMRDFPMAGLLGGVVEVDETYVGGKPRASRGKPVKMGRGTDKQPVLVLVSRDGVARAMPIPQVNGSTLKQAVRDHVHPSATIMTDELRSYHRLNREFTGGHFTVTHNHGEFVRRVNDGTDFVSTNTAESFFALLKRGFMVSSTTCRRSTCSAIVTSLPSGGTTAKCRTGSAWWPRCGQPKGSGYYMGDLVVRKSFHKRLNRSRL